MSIKRFGALLSKEVIHGPKNFILIWAVVAPLAFTLVVTLAWGSLFSDKPKLGIFDEGSSEVVSILQESDSLLLKDYGTEATLKEATENGAIDIGIIIPSGFDQLVREGNTFPLRSYIWGESLAKNRLLIPTVFIDSVRELSGQEDPVLINSVTVGDSESIPWDERLLPFLVLMAVFLSGGMLPASSIIQEKQKKTLQAVIITPATVNDFLMSKGFVGFILSLFIGIAILAMNQAFTAEPLLLVLSLGLGAIMAVEIGLIAGNFIKDITTLFTVWKSAGIFLFAPAIVYMFPEIPQWIGRIFPTYYILEPVVEISQNGGGWPEIQLEILILVILIIIGVFLVSWSAKRMVRLAE